MIGDPFDYDESLAVADLELLTEEQPDFIGILTEAEKASRGRAAVHRRVILWARLGMFVSNRRVTLTKERIKLNDREQERRRYRALFADRSLECPPLVHILGGAQRDAQLAQGAAPRLRRGPRGGAQQLPRPRRRAAGQEAT